MNPVVPIWLLLAAIGLQALSGVPALLRRTPAAHVLSFLLLLIGAVLGVVATAAALLSPAGALPGLSLPWNVPGGQFAVAIDGLSAAFLLPIFILPTLGSLYGLGYARPGHQPGANRLRFFHGVLAGSMALLVVARNAVLFLFGWEAMALSAFFLVTTEDEQRHVRDAGWVYLVATHVGTLCLCALFALLWAGTGTTSLDPRALPPQLVAPVFVLALVGFGMKAGLIPLHVWLPPAHANAPSHVSAAMSGVLIKMGVYGLLRVLTFFPQPPLWFGEVLLVLGALSGVLGMAYAIAQGDLKRMLAYCSIENIGIVFLGLGLCLLGRSEGRPDLVMLGLCGALLHVWNHGLFKSLLFLGAGAVIHATHTREMDQLGGLLRRMPRTGLYFLIGSAAICGLPPLNGFVSELFIYLGLFRGALLPGNAWVAVICAAPVLGLTGGLALLCFVKTYGAVFLGAARSDHTDHAAGREARSAAVIDPPLSMRAPMVILCGLCIGLGLCPVLAAPVLERAVLAFAPELVDLSGVGLGRLAPLSYVTYCGLILWGLVLGLGWALQRRVAAERRARLAPDAVGTWDCGYAAPAATMQYTSSSFGQMMVDLFHWALHPREERPPHRPHFPRSRESRYHRAVPDLILDRAILPSFRRGESLLLRFRFLQQGSLHAYILYILVAVLVLLWL